MIATDLAMQNRRKILDWLSPLDFRAEHADISSRTVAGTGIWLLKDRRFQEWLNAKGKTLWLNGLPGSGKTFLASIIVNHLQQSFPEPKGIAIAYIYCSIRDERSQSAVGLLRSLLQQLVEQDAEISDEVRSLFRRHAELTPSVLSTLLQSVVHRFSEVFVVIDALDEYFKSSSTRDDFLKSIEQLNPDIHLLVTSRHNLMTEYEFEKQAARVEIRALEDDIIRYLDYRIWNSPRLERYVEPELQADIIQTIVKEADGMFLLARLHMDLLATMTTTRDIRKALQNLPTQLDDMYDNVMKRILSQDDRSARLAEQVLSWLSYHFSRLLTVAEIRDALAVEPGDKELNGDARQDMDRLVSVCGGLVTVDQGTDTDQGTNKVRLVNYTTSIYLKRNLMDKFPNSQTRIAQICLTYVSFDEFAKGSCNTDEEMLSRLSKYPLLQYAAQHWGDHARGEPEEKVKKLAISFLQDSGKLMCSNQVMHLSEDAEERYAGYSQDFPKDVTGLEIAASFGLERIVQLLLEEKPENAAKSLPCAAENGHQAVVELLLEHGASVEAKDANGRTAILLAANNGHEAVVKLLLENGANVETKDANGRTAILLAANNGHEAVVKLLLKNGANVEAKDANGRTAILLAANKSHDHVVNLLLEKMVSVEAKDKEGTTALLQEIKEEHEEAIIKGDRGVSFTEPGPSQHQPPIRPEPGPSQRRPSIRPELGPSQHQPPIRPDPGPSQRRPSIRPELRPSQRQPSIRPELRPSQRQPPIRPEPGPSQRRLSMHSIHSNHSDTNDIHAFTSDPYLPDSPSYGPVKLKGGFAHCARADILKPSFTPGPYVVVGWFLKDWRVPVETLVSLVEEESHLETKNRVIRTVIKLEKMNKYNQDIGVQYEQQQYYVERFQSSKEIPRVFKPIEGHKVFAAIRKGVSKARGWREWLSLKELRGFGIYECTTLDCEHIRGASPANSRYAKKLKHFMEHYKLASNMEDTIVE